MKSSGQLIFLYDVLMTKAMQKKTKLNLKFISIAQLNGNLLWVKDTKKVHVFAIPNANTTKVIYGGLFYLENFSEEKPKLFAFYNNFSLMFGKTYRENLYDVCYTKVRPIKISKLSDLLSCSYQVGNGIECLVMIGNKQNPRIKNNTYNKKYYKYRRVDKNNFMKMLEEQNKGE